MSETDLSMPHRVIQVDRGSRDYGLSLIYRCLDKYEEKETGIFVARVVPQGQAQKYGVKENDKIISINNKTPRDVDDAVQIIKDAGKSVKLVVVRQEDVPDVTQAAQAAQMAQESPARQNVRNLINNYEPDNVVHHTPIEQTRTQTNTVEQTYDGRKSPGALSNKSGRYKSTISLAGLGLDNYPYPDYAEGTKLTRKDEKQNLQNLNNRLAGYIDKVRQLQRDNAKLSKQIKHIEEYQSKEVSNLKQIYDSEIESLKDALDALSKQYNQLKVASEGLLNENEELKDTLRRKDNDMKNSDNLINDLQTEVRDLSNKMGSLENERKKTQEKLDEVLPEVQKLQDKLAEAKKMLDDEVLKKADLENHCQRLDEELKFKIQLLEQQLTEVKTRKDVEITEMDSKLHEEYEDRLQKALNELRDVYDKQMAQNREDFSKLYETRVSCVTVC